MAMAQVIGPSPYLAQLSWRSHIAGLVFSARRAAGIEMFASDFVEPA